MCKKFGHLKKDCWQNIEDRYKKANERQNDETSFDSRRNENKCKICKKIGHLENDCSNGYKKKTLDNDRKFRKEDKSRRKGDLPISSDIMQPSNTPKNQDMLMLCMKTILDQWHQQNQE